MRDWNYTNKKNQMRLKPRYSFRNMANFKSKPKPIHKTRSNVKMSTIKLNKTFKSPSFNVKSKKKGLWTFLGFKPRK